MSEFNVRVTLTAEDLASPVILSWLQDLAYTTYEDNIAFSQSLDAMFAGSPGYLKRSHE